MNRYIAEIFIYDIRHRDFLRSSRISKNLLFYFGIIDIYSKTISYA